MEFTARTLGPGGVIAVWTDDAPEDRPAYALALRTLFCADYVDVGSNPRRYTVVRDESDEDDAAE